MIETFPGRWDNPAAVSAQARAANVKWWLWFLGLLGFTGLVGLAMLGSGPHPAMIGWLCYLACVVLIFMQPRYGVYMLLGLALIGDIVILPWYPFLKNFSSPESLLYLHNALIINPAETFIVLTYLSWLGRGLVRRKLAWYRGVLFWPAIVFTGFIAMGLVYGLSRGGDVTIALWEVRIIFFLPMMLILTSNLIETRAQVNRLIWIAMIAVFIDGVAGSWHVATELEFDLGSVPEIAEHSASIHANTLFVLAISAWLFRASYAKRLVLPLLIPPVALSYFANQRRAAFITIAIALVVMAVLLYWENRKAFWIVVPVGAVAGLFYLAVFWNSSGIIGMPANAIKSVVSEDAGDTVDQSSNLYRVLENMNIQHTIRTVPLTGVGFGNKFLIVADMADISFFAWWEYITHNSILWIWMQAGIGGFVSLIFLVGLSIIVGVRVLWRMPGSDLSAITLTAVLYIVMHFIYAYVDISWDYQSMIYVGAAMGLLNRLEHIVATPVPLPRKRWPWQPDPQPAPGLKPL